jgi:UTP--glucose-1-phosphate uridylyltransferase
MAFGYSYYVGKISKVVIPVAGLGTRFLPATKAQPKEMLPIVDKPAIQFVVEEAVAAGLSQILMITGRNKGTLENHFDHAYELEDILDSKGDDYKLGVVSESSDLADIHYVRQGSPLGLGHAVSKAETFVGLEPFAVLLGDDLIHHDDVLLSEMLDLSISKNATVVALMEIKSSETELYGVAKIDYSSSEINNIAMIKGFVEKPKPSDAPSSLAVIGRYVFQPSIFSALSKVHPAKNGEIQLTDALNLMAENQQEYGLVIGLVFRGRRYDTGDKLSYMKTVVEFAARRDDIGEEFTTWLSSFLVSSNK